MRLTLKCANGTLNKNYAVAIPQQATSNTPNPHVTLDPVTVVARSSYDATYPLTGSYAYPTGFSRAPRCTGTRSYRATPPKLQTSVDHHKFPEHAVNGPTPLDETRPRHLSYSVKYPPSPNLRLKNRIHHTTSRSTWPDLPE